MQPSSSNPVVFHTSQVPTSSQVSSLSTVQPTAISQVPSTSPTVMPSASTVSHSQAQRTPLPQPVVPQATQRHSESNQSCLTVVGVAGTVASLTAGTIACCVSPVVGLQVCGYGMTATGGLITVDGLHDTVRTSTCLTGSESSNPAGPAAPRQASMEDGPAHHPAVTTGGGLAITNLGLTALGLVGAAPVLPFSVGGAICGLGLAVYGACKN